MNRSDCCAHALHNILINEVMETEEVIYPTQDEVFDAESGANILKRDVVTRWTSTFEMIKSFVGQVKIVNLWLNYLRKENLVIQPTEEDFIPKLLKYIETFMKVTKTLESKFGDCYVR
uniref:CSON011907 protein n=1 Tax=Culicoides sonorensis TaxID=179676 RepID=A0A336M477_CULSO